MADKCDANGMCAPLAERCELSPSKGFKAVHTVNFETHKTRFFGVAYKRNARDRGLMLNVCPFCYGEPGGFERDRDPADAPSPSPASHEQVEALRSALQRTLEAYISSNYTCRIAQDDPVIVQARAALHPHPSAQQGESE